MQLDILHFTKLKLPDGSFYGCKKDSKYPRVSLINFSTSDIDMTPKQIETRLLDYLQDTDTTYSWCMVTPKTVPGSFQIEAYFL